MKEHLVEFMLIFVLAMLLGFVILQAHGHNDQLASKGMDFIYGDLGALWGLTQKSKSDSRGDPSNVPPVVPKTEPTP